MHGVADPGCGNSVAFASFDNMGCKLCSVLSVVCILQVHRTGSPMIVKECQSNFNFIPIQSQINIRTARFLQKFIASENSLCSLFATNAVYQLSQIT